MAANGMFDAEANATLDARLPSPSTVDLYTTMPTASGGTASGTKVAGGGYAQGSVAMAAAASRSKASNAALTFSNLPDTSGAGGVKGIDLNGRWFMPFASARITNAGDSMVFASGAITAGYTNGT